MIKACIFDLDGTLVDSLDDIATSLNAVLAREGRPLRAREEVRLMIGNGMSVLVRRAIGLPEGGDEEVARLRALVEAEYDLRCLEKTRPYPGVPELLSRLRAKGLRLALLSNKPDAFVETMARALFPAGTFAAARGQRSGVVAKPDPAAALGFAADWGLAPEELAFVGDSAVDVETGRRAGMAALGVAWGFRGRAELEAAGADAVFDDAASLGDWLEARS